MVGWTQGALKEVSCLWQHHWSNYWSHVDVSQCAAAMVAAEALKVLMIWFAFLCVRGCLVCGWNIGLLLCTSVRSEDYRPLSIITSCWSEGNAFYSCVSWWQLPLFLFLCSHVLLWCSACSVLPSLPNETPSLFSCSHTWENWFSKQCKHAASLSASCELLSLKGIEVRTTWLWFS